MARFDAGTSVEKLEYDFTTHSDYDGTAPGKGQIREFSDKQLRDFSKEVNAVYRKVDPNAKDGKKATAEAVAGLSDERMDSITTELTAVIARFCGESPSNAELSGLPFRVRQEFMRWLLRELFSPKDSTPGSSASRAM